LGGYQSIILLNSPEKPDLRSLIEEAYNESIPLFVEQQKWPDVLENCDKYLRRSPGKISGRCAQVAQQGQDEHRRIGAESA